jgi:RHS repeat-associated protein
MNIILNHKLTVRKLLLIICLLPLLSISQTTTQNYIKSNTYKDQTTTSDPSKAKTQVTYFDGLGRPIQEVEGKGSNDGTDIITHFAYDNLGRMSKSFLPYASGNAELFYDGSAEANTLTYYSADGPANTSNPYSEKFYDNSPLNRVLKLGAPGNDWKGSPDNNTDHTIKYAYLSNTSTEVKKLSATVNWNQTNGVYDITFVSNGNYPAGQLYKTITQNENRATSIYLGSLTLSKGNTIEEFKDTDGKVVLKRVYNEAKNSDGFITVSSLSTYYVYDQYGNLTYVLPPNAAGNFSEELCYQYKYDHRNRLVEKKLPGKQWEFIVYDTMDRVVATGPVLSPFGGTDKGWMVIKYDNFGRIAYTGWYASSDFSSLGRKTFQANNFGIVTKTTTSQTVDNIPVNYTVNFPSSMKLLTVNYYDNYTFPGGPTLFSDIEGQTVRTNVKGLATGSWTRVLTSPTEYLGTTAYTLLDNKSQPILTYEKNYLGGYTQNTLKLDFDGSPLYTITTHKRLSTSVTVTVREDFTYTPQDRLQTHTHKIDTKPTELMSSNVYDGLGKLVTKKVGGSDLTGVTALQNVGYEYNPRGWLLRINNPGDLALPNQPQDLFALSINYNDAVPFNVNGKVVPLYNGNISGISWRTSSDNMYRQYNYTYDGINQLTDAWYQLPYASSILRSSYDEHISYDSNGNIKSLGRNGELDSATTIIPIDDLAYTYDPVIKNRLLKVTDATAHPAGFNDVNSSGDDFTYDEYGNMLTDVNKGIVGILYNHMNLPTQITFSDGKILKYTYDASGTKLKKQFNGQTTGTEYLSGFQYSNASLNFFPTAEGYVKVTVNKLTGAYIFNYVYNYVDHLGNVRLSYTVDPADGIVKIIDENHYYPLGLKHNGYTSTSQTLEPRTQPPFVVLTPLTSTNAAYKYEFSGKEIQDEGGYNMYDFGARHYDPALGRWMNIDPLAEKTYSLSPYSYANNNPVYFIDPDGRHNTPYDSANTGLIIRDAYGRDKFGEDGMYIAPDNRGPNQLDFSNFENNASDESDTTSNANNSGESAGNTEQSDGGGDDPKPGRFNFSEFFWSLFQWGKSDEETETNNDNRRIFKVAADEAVEYSKEANLMALDIFTLPLGGPGKVQGAKTVIRTVNGIRITGFTGHALERILERAVKPAHILEALKTPLKVAEVVFDKLGRPSQRFIGKHSEVVVNPTTGKILSVNPTSTKKAAKLIKQFGP